MEPGNGGRRPNEKVTTFRLKECRQSHCSALGAVSHVTLSTPWAAPRCTTTNTTGRSSREKGGITVIGPSLSHRRPSTLFTVLH